MIKKIFYVLFLSATNLSLVYANEVENTFPNEIPKKTIGELLATVINALLGLVGIMAIYFIIVGGFQYITSSGNPEQVAKAKNTLLYAILGLIVVIISYAIVKFIIEALT